MKILKVLIACEESQAVCIEFRKLGHEAYSCDLLPCSGGHPEWHIQMDIFKVLDNSFQMFGQFWTEGGTVEYVDKWDLMIGHPECTRLTLAGNKWYKPEFKERFPTINEDRISAISFFMKLINADIERIAIENLIGIMSSIYQKPNQIIQPHYFGDTERKSTCLWLKNLPSLVYCKEINLFDKVVTNVKPDIVTYKNGKTDSRLHYESLKLPKEERRKLRSKTFPGIAKAMAEQWSNYILEL